MHSLEPLRVQIVNIGGIVIHVIAKVELVSWFSVCEGEYEGMAMNGRYWVFVVKKPIEDENIDMA